MKYEPLAPMHLPPLEVARETFLLRSAQPAFGGAPMSVAINSLIIRGEQPVIVDTNAPGNREAWLNDVTSVVDPAAVRWVFISHDDIDHTGNLAEILVLCPNATLVINWGLTERMTCAIDFPVTRLRWQDNGEDLDVGDRVLRAVRPPAYDSPTTRGLFDPTTGVYWASDAFATPMPAEPVDDVSPLPADMWVGGMAMFHHHALSPWLSLVDRNAYSAEVDKVQALDPQVIVSAHTPVIRDGYVKDAINHLRALPDTAPPPAPDQRVLEAILGVTAS